MKSPQTVFYASFRETVLHCFFLFYPLFWFLRSLGPSGKSGDSPKTVSRHVLETLQRLSPRVSPRLFGDFSGVPWPEALSRIGGLQKGGFPKGWFRRMFPQNENRNEGTFAKNHPFTKPPFSLPVTLFSVDKRVVSKRVVSADVPPERKPERGHVRQTHPFTKPPFSLPVREGQTCNN